MSEKRRVKGSSVMGNKTLGVGSNTTNDPGTKKKSLSRISSSASQAEGVVKKHKKKKGDVPAEEDEDDLDFPRDENGKKKNVIWDKTMTNLRAANDIQKVREEMLQVRAPKHLKKITMTVEKKNPNFRKIRTVGVVIPAPKDIESRPLLPPVQRGPKLDECGEVVPYTILGSVDNYMSQACRHGIYYQTAVPKRPATEMPKVTFSRPKRIQPRHIPNVDELRALQYWKDIIADRERQKSNIIVRTGRDPSEVIMGEARTHSKYRIIRGEITLPGVLENHYTIPRRKGTRGTGFWTQPTLFGEDVTGIYGSLTQTEKGHPKGVEYVGVPDDIRKEKGYIPLKNLTQSEDPDLDIPHLHGICATGLSKPHNRDAEPIINVDNSYTSLPEQTTPIEPIELTFAVPSCPSVLFGGHPARWCNNVTLGVAVKAEVGMNGIAGQRMDNSLVLTNTGSTTIFYDWKRLPQKDTFELKKDRIQRFYFDSCYVPGDDADTPRDEIYVEKSTGIILPGETKHIRAIFKSPNPGIFSETWKFESRPLLEDGMDIILKLWGIARAVDVNLETRLQVERTLRHRGAVSVCTDILDEVFRCLDLTETAKSPRRKSYRWIFENAPRVDDHFKAINKGFYYHSSVVKGLTELTPIFNIESGSESDTSSDLDSVQILSLATLKKTLESLPEEDENRVRLLWKFHRSVGNLSFPVQRPISAESFSIGRVLMSLFIDDMVTTSQRLRTLMGIYSESNIPGGMMSRIKNISKDIKGRRKTQSQLSSEAAAIAPSKNSGGSSRRKSQMGKASAEGAMQKLKDLQAVTKSRPDPLRYRKYKEKFYCETYSLLGDMVEKLFSQLTGLATPPTTIVQE